MHDILEGVAQFEDKLALQYIQNNFLNAEQLAGRIHDFDYGYNQQRNRPPRVKLFDGSNDFGYIQSWCLLRNMQGSQVSRIGRETHAFQPVHTLTRHTLYFSRKKIYQGNAHQVAPLFFCGTGE